MKNENQKRQREDRETSDERPLKKVSDHGNTDTSQRDHVSQHNRLEAELQAWKACAFYATNDRDITPEKLKKELEKLQHDHRTVKEQLRECKKRESELVVRLTQKEKDCSLLEACIKDLQENMDKSALQMRTTFMDPLVNANFKFLQAQLVESNRKLVAAEQDLKGMQFSAETLMGQQLIQKCRRLQDENKEFGKQLSEGRVHKMELESALSRKMIEELKEGLDESHGFTLDLDAELESLQHTLLKFRGAVPHEISSSPKA